MERIQLPEGFDAEYEDGVLELELDGETVSKKLEHPLVHVEIDSDEISFEAQSNRRNVESVEGTFRGHVKNMVEGLENGHVYKMKGVYAHFPMTISQQGNEVHLENFMGERADRVIEVMDGAEVEIDGEDLTIRGSDKEAVAQTAARIEQACFKGDRDPRTFQDGVYITGGDGE